MAKSIYSFGPFELDQDREEIRSTVAGVRPINKTRYQILEHLIANRGTKIPNMDLIDAVWGRGARADEGGLRSQINLLRTWLEKNGGGATEYIRNSRDKAYEFVFEPVSVRPVESRLAQLQSTEGTLSRSPFARAGMEAMFLLLDEELINNREGRQTTSYTPRKIAYWLNFYSILFDRIYVPVNFLLDSNVAPAVLEALRVQEGNSSLRGDAEDGQVPFRILWDTSRFGTDTDFADLLAKLESDQSYITKREHDIGIVTARLCNDHLKQMVIPRDMTARLDPKESVEQLRTEVFNPAENHALEVHTLNRLTQCLDRVVERGDLLAKGAEYGYGRTFYYTLWGYGFNAVQEGTAGQFRDIIDDYWLLRDHFLTAVDYVSNSLKAKFASNALGRQIDIILPREYGNAVLRPETVLLNRYSRATRSVGARSISIAVDAVINMTSDQLLAMHRSDEYRNYTEHMLALDDLAVTGIRPSDISAVETALSLYLDFAARVLSQREQGANLVRLSGEVAADDYGISAFVNSTASKEGTHRRPNVTEICSASRGGVTRERPDVPPGSLLPQLIRVSRGVKIYLS